MYSNSFMLHVNDARIYVFMIYYTFWSLNLVLHYLKMKHTMLSDAKLALYQILQFWITEHAFILFFYPSLVIHMLWQKHGTLTRNKKKYSYGLCSVNNTYLHPDRLVPLIWFLLFADVVKRVAVKLLGCRIWRFLHQAHGAHRYAYKLVYGMRRTQQFDKNIWTCVLMCSLMSSTKPSMYFHLGREHISGKRKGESTVLIIPDT